MAYADSPLLFWLDRKGFIIAKEEARIGTILKLRERGAQYYVGTKEGELAAELGQRFRIVSSSGDYALFALESKARAMGAGKR